MGQAPIRATDVTPPSGLAGNSKTRSAPVFSLAKKGAAASGGEAAAREPGLGTGRGGDVTGFALFLCSNCFAFSAKSRLRAQGAGRRAISRGSGRSATAA